jgi:hypothetical protein
MPVELFLSQHPNKNQNVTYAKELMVAAAFQ